MGFLDNIFGGGKSSTYSLARAKQLEALLPTITDAHLSTDFTDEFEKGTYGPGEPKFWEGFELANQRDDNGAIRLWAEAIEQGLTGILLANAHANMGQVYIDLEMFPESVDSFIACLTVSPKPPSMAWQSAKRLSYYYDSAGRQIESATLDELAEVANNALPHRQMHPAEAVQKHGELAKAYSDRLASGEAPPAHWSSAAGS